MLGGLKLKEKLIRVMMIGPARTVKGGITTVVDNYYHAGLDKLVDLKYIESCNDSNKISKFFKELNGIHEFKKNIDNYDVIHIHVASRRSTFRKGKYVRIAKNKGKKVILHIHGAEYKIFYNECNENQKKYVKETLALCDKIIVLSEEWKDYFKDLVDESKIRVIYNSIVLPEDFNKDLNTKKILFLGRIGQRKGIYDLIDVMEKLVLDYSDIKLYVGGDGETEKLKQIIYEKNLENNIIYVGWTSGEKKEKLLKECSFFVLPSYNEGMPMSVLEGMAYKNVVIATNVGGIPKVIKNEENGFIIEPGDKENLYNYLKILLENHDKCGELSQNARNCIENKFNIEKEIRKVREIYA